MSTEFSWKEKLRTPKGKLIAASCALVFTWAVLILVYAGDVARLIPNESNASGLRKQIAKLEQEDSVLQGKLKKASEAKKLYREKMLSSWNLQRDGEPETALPQKIEAAAKEVKLQLSTFGSVRTSRINQEFFFAELDVSAQAQYELIVRFISKVEEIKPEISWRRITISQAMRRPQAEKDKKANSIITNSTRQASYKPSQNLSEVMFSGTLRVIVHDSEAGKEAAAK